MFGIRQPKGKKDISPDIVQNSFDNCCGLQEQKGHYLALPLMLRKPMTAKAMESSLMQTFPPTQRRTSPLISGSSRNSLTTDSRCGVKLMALMIERDWGNRPDKNIEITATSLIGKFPRDFFDSFELSDDKQAVENAPWGILLFPTNITESVPTFRHACQISDVHFSHTGKSSSQ